MWNVSLLNNFHVFLSCYRSNLVGTRFTVFNNGVNPKKGGCMSDGSNIREEVAAIIYVSDVFVSGETTYFILQQKDVHFVMLVIIAWWFKKVLYFLAFYSLMYVVWQTCFDVHSIVVAPFFFYQLFWTQACPEGMGTIGTHRSHARCHPYPIPQRTVEVGHTRRVYVPYPFQTVVWVLLHPTQTDQWKCCETGRTVFHPYLKKL